MMRKAMRRGVLAGAVLGMLAGFAGPSGAAFVDFTTIPNGSAASFNLNGVTVTGSANVNSGALFGYRGLGVVGGRNDLSLDLGETLTIDYNQLVQDVTIRILDIDPPGNVNYAFQAFNGNTSLGVFAIAPHAGLIETKDLSALAGGQSFTRITLILNSSAPLGLQVQATEFTPASAAVPEPSSLALCGLASLAGLGLRARRRRQAA